MGGDPRGSAQGEGLPPQEKRRGRPRPGAALKRVADLVRVCPERAAAARPVEVGRDAELASGRAPRPRALLEQLPHRALDRPAGTRHVPQKPEGERGMDRVR